MRFLKQAFPIFGTGVGTLVPVFATMNLISSSQLGVPNNFDNHSISFSKTPRLSEVSVLKPTKAPKKGKKPVSQSEGKENLEKSSESVSPKSKEESESKTLDSSSKIPSVQETRSSGVSKGPDTKRKFVTGINDFFVGISDVLGGAKKIWQNLRETK